MKIQNQSNVIYNAVIPNQPETPGSLTSNTVSTEVLSYSVSKVIRCDKTLAKEGETVHITVTVTNNSETKLTHNFIGNPTPKGATYVAGSVKLNGAELPSKDMTSGFFLPDLNPGESLTVEYDMQINNPMTVTPVTDVSQFQYVVTEPQKGEVRYKEYTDPVSINVVFAKLSVVKSVDKAFAIKGETLTYTVTMTNEGNIDINDIYFTDNIPQGTTFVEQSVFINDQNIPAYRPDAGYSVASLPPNSSATTSFKVTID